VQRSGKVRLSVLHADTTISSAAITAPVARILPVVGRRIGRVGLLSLLSCHLGATGERQYDEERSEPSLQVHWY